jgi:uncharacterized protein YgbK (DUF1537 family)
LTARYAFYGDDFTGATDTLATLAQAGVATLLFLGVPDRARLAAAGRVDAVGIAGVSRSLAPAAMAAELEPVARFFASLDATVVHYKCCSTFDSAPHVGSIGAAVQCLQAAVPHPLVAIVGGQPSLGRYCVFGHLFATAGAEPVHRIDRHPTMSRHPVTPMTEPDLRRHLAHQGLENVALVDLRAQGEGFDAAVFRVLDRRPDAVLFDVADDEHLRRIGRMLWQQAQTARLLAVGASSVAQALVAAWRGSTNPAASSVGPAQGPVFVLAGSQSPVTRHQVQSATAYRRVPVDAVRLVQDDAEIDSTAARCAALLDNGRSVIAHTTHAQAGGPAPLAVAHACARLLARVLQRCPAVRRVGVAGGDTSSHAVRRLDIWGLEFAGSLAPGVTLVRSRSDLPLMDGIEWMLKGGQMGPPDVFDRLLPDRQGGAGSG